MQPDNIFWLACGLICGFIPMWVIFLIRDATWRSECDIKFIKGHIAGIDWASARMRGETNA